MTPSMERGAIDAGHEGDKVVGFDPATAPMETDAEAGGTATQPRNAPLTGSRVEPGFNGTAHGTAMKHMSTEAENRSAAVFVVSALVVVAVAILIGLFFLSR